MANSLRDQAWRFICATFPERQIYIRSDGRVQFFTFGPLMQTIMAGITLAFLGWVAFTSVNVVFKDHIIAAKDKRFQQMQTSYEARVSDLQLAYDSLNAALVTAEDGFKSRANQIEAKQHALFDLIHRKQTLESMVAVSAMGPASVVPANSAPAGNTGATDSLPVDDTNVIGPPGTDAFAPGSATPGSQQKPEDPVLRRTPLNDRVTGSPSKSSFLEGVERLAGAIFTRKRQGNLNIDHPALRAIVTETSRLEKFAAAEDGLATDASQNVADAISHLDRAVRVAGLDTEALVSRVSAANGEGGPLIPLVIAGITGIANGAAVADDLARISGKLDDLYRIVRAMRSVPLTVPVQGPTFDLSSGFGARVDPFTRRWAFHAGLDFTGPYGSTIHATAPGTVVYAGPRGPYGTAVEIDHGMGFKTRYGHLSAVLVSPGMKVEKGTPVGRLGSSGRSTGPHVHYEVWYGDAVKDPKKFIEAGRYVLKE